MDGEPEFPANFDPAYFSGLTWAERVADWVENNESHGFSDGNATLVRQVLADDDTGLRVVVNITGEALSSMLRDGRYKNLYEKPVIGGEVKTFDDVRRQVDDALGLGRDTYFGALALGGSGVRFYGQYCMVLRLGAVDPATQLFDRDSYDILLPPLVDVPMGPDEIGCLRGEWGTDGVDMALLRVLPEIGHDSRLVTSGTISDLVLRDQEFIEAHLRQAFGPDELEEVRESPDDASAELAILERRRNGLRTSTVEREWLRRRARVARLLDDRPTPIRHRVVTMYGKGYQWT